MFTSVVLSFIKRTIRVRISLQAAAERTFERVQRLNTKQYTIEFFRYQ